MVSLFDSITPKKMAEFQHQDNQIAPIFAYIEQDQKPSKKNYLPNQIQVSP